MPFRTPRHPDKTCYILSDLDQNRRLEIPLRSADPFSCWIVRSTSLDTSQVRSAPSSLLVRSSFQCVTAQLAADIGRPAHRPCAAYFCDVFGNDRGTRLALC